MKKLITSIFLAAPLAALAAPSAGELLQQVPSIGSQIRKSEANGVNVNQTERLLMPDTAPFLVKSLKIVGNDVIPFEVLHALVADAEGNKYTLSQLDKVISRITDYFAAQGYPLARALLPAQVIAEGNVTVLVVVAKYGKVNVVNNSRTSESILAATLAPLRTGDTIHQPELNRAVLLASDLPGVLVTSSLAPGADVGSSDLEVKTEAAPRVSGFTTLDNYGSASTGVARVSGSVTIVDPLRLRSSDQLTISGLSSGAGMNYGRVGYEVVVNGQGTRIGTSLSSLKYVLGGAVAGSHTEGRANVESVFIKQPLVRKVDENLYAQVQYDKLNLKDNSGSVQTYRNGNNVTASIIGDSTDSRLGGGRNNINVSLVAGRVNFTNPDAQAADASAANTQGSFAKLVASASRLQRLGANSDILISATEQFSSKNLDSSQKMILGGAGSVRGFKFGAASGDSGYSMTAEYRRRMGYLLGGAATGFTFLDTAKVSVNHNPMNAATANTVVLSSAGFGLLWTAGKGYSVKSYVATTIGSLNSSLNPTNSTSVWVEVANGF